MARTRSEDTKTPLCRFAFTQGLFKPQTSKAGKEQWTCSLLFPKGSDLSVLEKLVLETAKAEWGDKAVQMLKDKLIKNPCLDGDGPQGKSKKTGEPHAGFPGNWFIRPMSGLDFRPKLFNKKLLPATQEEFYSGAYGYAVVNAFAWENTEQGKGVSFGISMAQVVKDGDRLGGGERDANEFFDKIEDEGEAPAETKSGAGAAGLFA